MVAKCCVTSCRLQSDDPGGSEVSFHKLPARQSSREEWMKLLKKHCPTTISQKHLYVCSQHFEIDCFQYTGLCQRRMLKSGSVPSIFYNFEMVKCEERSPSPEIQESSNRCAQCDSILIMPEDIIGSLPRQNEHFEKMDGVENHCQSHIENIGIHLTDPSLEETLEHNPSNNILNRNNADDDEQTKIKKQLQDKIAMLERRNRNLGIRLVRCRKKMYHYKNLCEMLKRKKFISHGGNARRLCK